jgi:hypothetical protein
VPICIFAAGEFGGEWCGDLLNDGGQRRPERERVGEETESESRSRGDLQNFHPRKGYIWIAIINLNSK